MRLCAIFIRKTMNECTHLQNQSMQITCEKRQSPPRYRPEDAFTELALPKSRRWRPVGCSKVLSRRVASLERSRAETMGPEQHGAGGGSRGFDSACPVVTAMLTHPRSAGPTKYFCLHLHLRANEWISGESPSETEGPCGLV